MAVLASALWSPAVDAGRRGGVAVQGEILSVRCGAARQGAVCRIEGRRVLVELTGARIFAGGARATCDALRPGARFAAYGGVVSRDPLALDACLFVQREPDDDVAEICGEITRIRAADGVFVLSAPGRGDTLVRTEPGVTRIRLQGEAATIDDLAVGMSACAAGLLRPGDPLPTLRPTIRVNARIDR
jgi:hypothetical protein